MRWWRDSCAALTVLLALAPAATAAEGGRTAAVVPGVSRTTAARIAEARQLAAAKKWPEALTELQYILDTAGDDLVPVNSRRSVPARRKVHALLAGLPHDVLRQYRDRANPVARRWLEQGTATRDEDLLHRVADEAFCSRPAEKALELLGDLAFEHGAFDAAAEWYDRLAPPAGTEPVGGGDAASYPDPQGDPARVRAKALLARLFRGGDSVWDVGLRAFRDRHPDAAGSLGTRAGRYADVLSAYAADTAARPADDEAWSTFGGGPGRGRVVAARPGFLERLGGLCRPGPLWRFGLDDRVRLEGEPALPSPPPKNADRSRAMAFFPLLAGPYALVADCRYLTAYDLRTGEPEKEPWYDADALPGAEPGVKVSVTKNPGVPPPPDVRYTLTRNGDFLYARVGTPGVGDAGERSALVCVRLRPGPGGGRVRWAVTNAGASNSDRESPPAFEGAPLAAGDRVYVAVTRVTRDRTVTAVHCYAADADGVPPLRWRSDVAEAREPLPSGAPRYRHHLLTLAGGNVVFCSHAGSVVALDARTGKPAWAALYPPRAADPDEPIPPPPPDPAPCVSAGGLLYAAPADADRLLCLDPATGRLRWEREGVRVAQLLGVGHGRLIFTTPRGLRAVDAAGGGDAGGWVIEPTGEAALAPLGRGLLVGDVVLWPHAAPDAGDPPDRTGVVSAVRQDDGRPAADPTLLRNVPVGNLVYDDGRLAVAGRDTLAVFAPPAEAPPGARIGFRRPRGRLQWGLGSPEDSGRTAGGPRREVP